MHTTSMNREPFAIDEWYHCYNRGVEKRTVFESEFDASRFLMLLYLANSERPIGLFNMKKPEVTRVLTAERGSPIVAIGAYCLMPNHYHILVKEIVEGGISSFMRKLSIAYTMYFNEKNERTGNLFLRPFRSRHVATDRYLQRVISYIHFNPAELYETKWKEGRVKNIRALERRLIEYPYSSLRSYVNTTIKDPILSAEGFEVAHNDSISQVLEDARAYYAEVADERLEQ